MRITAFLLGLSVLSACAPFPQLDTLGGDIGPPPALVPIDDLLAQADTTASDPGPAVAARAAALKARASAIGAQTAP